MDDEKIESVEDLASELAKSLEEPEEVKPEETPAEPAPPPEQKIMWKGEEKSVKELEDIWDNWQKDYTVKTQGAAEVRQQAEEMLRRAEGYYQASQNFAQQRQPEPEEEDDTPYMTKEKYAKSVQPLVDRLTAIDNQLKERALTDAIKEAQSKYPNSDAREILIEAIASYKSNVPVNLTEIARVSHERRSKTEMTLENIPNDWREKIFQQELEKRKTNASKQTITQDSGKAPALGAEKLRFEDTASLLEEELKKSLGLKS